MTTTTRGEPVTSSDLRRVTGNLVLQALRGSEGAVSVAGLMSMTGLSRNAVHEVCADLVGLELIAEAPADDEPAASARRSGPGRPARYYTYAAGGAVLAVDLGVNTVSLQVTDLRGTLRSVASRHVDDPTVADRTRLLDELADEALLAADTDASQVLVAAVGVPMAISSNTKVHYPDSQRVVDVVERWAASRGWPVLIENDANLAALGELRVGAARGYENVVVILAAERLGAGIIADGNLVRGEHASAGELRFVALMPEVQPVHLGVALHTRQLAERALADGSATAGLRSAAHSAGEITAPMVFRAAESGDQSATAIVRAVCERLARLIGVLATLLDPALVIISGGVAEAGALLASTTQQQLPTWMIDHPPEIAVSPLTARAVLVGATAHALDYVEAHQLVA